MTGDISQITELPLVSPAISVAPPFKGMMIAAFVVFMLLLMGGNLLTQGGGDLSGDGNPIRQVGYMLALVMALCAMRPWTDLTRLLVIPKSLVMAILWCWISLVWAIEPSIALRRILLTSIIIWTVFLIVREMGYRQAIALIRIALLATLICNYIAVVLFPEMAIHQFDPVGDPGLIGDWRGITPQKNFTGALCAITILIFLFDNKSLTSEMLVVILSSFFLYKTGSKTSLGILSLCIVAGVLFKFYDQKFKILLIPISAMLGAVLVVVYSAYVDRILLMLDDPGALTGRSQIWPVLISYARDHWLLGSGYGSFWNIGPYSPVFDYATGWVADLAIGHNGYLDLLTQIGTPGLIIVCAACFVLPLYRIFTCPSLTKSQGSLIIAVIIFCAGHNMTESSLFDRDSYVQVFLMLIVATLSSLVADPLSSSAEAEDLIIG